MKNWIILMASVYALNTYVVRPEKLNTIPSPASAMNSEARTSNLMETASKADEATTSVKKNAEIAARFKLAKTEDAVAQIRTTSAEIASTNRDASENVFAPPLEIARRAYDAARNMATSIRDAVQEAAQMTKESAELSMKITALAAEKTFNILKGRHPSEGE